MTFHDLTILGDGRLWSRRLYDTAELVPAAVEVFQTLFDAHPAGCQRCPLPFERLADLAVTWTPDAEAATRPAALGTFWVPDKGQQVPILSFCVLPGGEPASDARMARAFGQLVAQQLGLLSGGKMEPAFDLSGVADRPLTAASPFPYPGLRDWQEICGDAQTCAAAAWLLRQ